MAERRMFAKTIIDSDAFLDMSATARLLYYDLGMRADDDGFVNSPKKILRMIGASEDDLRILILRKFIIPFENGVIVIRHWKIHNYIRKDTYNETYFKEQKALLFLDKSGTYRLLSECQENCVDEPSTERPRAVDTGKDRLGKDRSDKDSIGYIGRAHIRPTLEEIAEYCIQRKSSVDPQHFFDYYEANGWVQGKGKPIKDWKAAVRTWESNDRKRMVLHPNIRTDNRHYDYAGVGSL